MPDITIEALEAKRDEFAALIELFKTQPHERIVAVAADQVVLRPGECYGGAALNADGSVAYHLVGAKVHADHDLDHAAAIAWAKAGGYELANKLDIRLLQANARDWLPKGGWCWLEEEHGSSYAWGCSFNNGNVYYDDRSSEGGAVGRVFP
jgi:hypothetical protein